MGVEVGAKFAIFEADEKTDAFLADRVNRPYEHVAADPDASYEAEYEFDLSDLTPMVARPGDPGNGVPVEGVKAERVKVDQAFLGSCTNARLEDLEVAARILDGKQVHPDVRMLVSPSSQEVFYEALKAGYLETLAKAGALIEHSTCGPCYGGHLGVLGDGETCISSSNRNFQGRMGSPLANVWLASPATVAASAIAGEIADPRDYL
jgi:3-isopropylmalate/(R)-2-methylmalate dehydratase large subunit